MGSQSVRSMLLRMDGASVEEMLKEDGSLDFRYVSFDANRYTFMAAEAIMAPAFIAPEYLVLRSQVMRVVDDRMQAWLQARPALRRPLFAHQDEFCALAFGLHGMFNGSEQGTGKTATVVSLSSAWKIPFTFVVVPGIELVQQWFREWHDTLADSELEEQIVIPLVDASEPYSVKPMPVAERMQTIRAMMHMAVGEGKRLVAITNYETLVPLVKQLAEFFIEYKTFLALDEAWKLKSHRSQVSGAAMDLATHAERVVAMTGTPTGQGIGDLWSQLNIVQRGQEMEDFKDWDANYTLYSILPGKNGGRMTKRPVGCKDPIGLMRRIAPVFYRAPKAVCTDIPPKLPVQRVVLDFMPEVAEIYKSVKKYGQAALGDGSSLLGERQTILLLQQICGGFLYNPDGTYTEEEAGQPHDLRLRLIHSPKMDWVRHAAENQWLGNPSYRVLIWCKFNAEVLHIAQELKKVLGDHRAMACVGDKTHVKDSFTPAVKESFNSLDPDGMQVLVCQYKKMAYGHNLQGACHSVNYSHTWSHVEKSQSGDRAHRQGCTHSVEFTELVVRGTVDVTILHATDRLKDMSERYSPDTIGQ
jgi:SNF2 family DNA or RNA helicase